MRIQRVINFYLVIIQFCIFLVASYIYMIYAVLISYIRFIKIKKMFYND